MGYMGMGLADDVSLGQVHEGVDQQLQHPGEELKWDLIINKCRRCMQIDNLKIELDLFEHPLLMQ